MQFSVFQSNDEYIIGTSNSKKGGGLVNGPLSAPKQLIVPSYVNGKKITKIGDNAFYYCNNTVSIEIEQGIKVLGTYSFCRCKNLESVLIPRSVTRILSAAFEDNYKLSNVTILQNSELTELQTYTFNECTKLSFFVIPAGVTIFGTAIFSDITVSLTIITYSKINNYDKDMFRGNNNVKVYGPLNGASYFGNKKIIQISLERNIPYSKNKCQTMKSYKILYSLLIIFNHLNK